MGIEIEENSELDLLVSYRKHEGDDRINGIVEDMARELGADGNHYPDLLPRMAQFELTLLDWMNDHKGACEYVAFANKCWPAFPTEFGLDVYTRQGLCGVSAERGTGGRLFGCFALHAPGCKKLLLEQHHDESIWDRKGVVFPNGSCGYGHRDDKKRNCARAWRASVYEDCRRNTRSARVRHWSGTKGRKPVSYTHLDVYKRQIEERTQGKEIRVICFDTNQYVRDYVERGIIDYVICQEPKEQGYQSVKKLFDYFVDGAKGHVDDYITKAVIKINENMNFT